MFYFARRHYVFNEWSPMKNEQSKHQCRGDGLSSPAHINYKTGDHKGSPLQFEQFFTQNPRLQTARSEFLIIL
jgi:hypothetical protein